MSKSWTKTIAIVAMLCMLLSTDVFAGPGSSGGKKKMGFFAKIGKAIKQASHKAATAVKNAAHKTATAIKNTAVKAGQAVKNAAIKTGHAIKTAGAKMVNGVMDTGVWAKQKLIGKKNKVWVCGHYDKNGKWTKGHWRKLSAGKPSAGGNTADQGNYADQSSAADQGNTTDQGSEMPAENTDAGMSGDGVSNEASDMPVAGEDPALPEMTGDDFSQPAEQSEQTSQESAQSEQAEQTEQSGEAAQGADFNLEQNVSMRTMGMLMDDIVKQSQSITNFKRSANPNISYSVEVQEDINTTYAEREDDAALLVRVIVWDLQRNNGESGKYFSFFLSRMQKLTPESRKLIQDVTNQVREGIVHGSNNVATEEEKAVYNKRLAEMANY